MMLAAAMEASETFGWQHFTTLGTLALSLCAVLLSLLRNKAASSEIPPQALACNYDHKNISVLLVQQGESLAALVRQNGELVSALSAFAHAAELRHQTVVHRLDAMESNQHAHN
jgi:hypothetical protein